MPALLFSTASVSEVFARQSLDGVSKGAYNTMLRIYGFQKNHVVPAAAI